MANQWLLMIDEKEYGPYAVAQIKQFAEDGRIVANSLLRREDDDKWHRADRIAGIKEIISSMPPPFPIPTNPAPIQIVHEAPREVVVVAQKANIGKKITIVSGAVAMLTPFFFVWGLMTPSYSLMPGISMMLFLGALIAFVIGRLIE